MQILKKAILQAFSIKNQTSHKRNLNNNKT